MSSTAVRRLNREIATLAKDSPPGVSASPTNDNILNWQGLIFGPENTPYEGGIFELSMTFRDEYPFSPPKVRFMTDVFHPNVGSGGRICLDILEDKWSPCMEIRTILMSIQSLLVSPGLHAQPQGAANAEAEYLFVNNRVEYNQRVRRLVQTQLDQYEKSTIAGSSFCD